MSVLMLAALLGMIALAGREALLDRTPMRPFSWRRPDLEWWAHRKTRREMARGMINLETPAMAPTVAGRHLLRRFLK